MENENKISDSSRRIQGKRQLAVEETCKIELETEIEYLFEVFAVALAKATKALGQFPPHSRSRTLEASIVQSCFAESLIDKFGESASYGKYKRLVLKAKNYLILFKKLNKKGYPMNIKTGNVQGILEQNMSADLFADTDYNDEPILYFGYKVNKFGAYHSPQLVYIDEGKIKFTIGVGAAQMSLMDAGIVVPPSSTVPTVEPKLKQNIEVKKAI